MMSQRHRGDIVPMHTINDALASRWHRKMDLSWKRVGFIAILL
jgi:hypothetical protein